MVSIAPKPSRKAAEPHQLSATFADPDLVDRIFALLLADHPELQGRAEHLERQVRAEFAGETVYIAKRPPSQRQREVAEVLSKFNGRNASEVARVLQISRGQVYRILKQAGGR